MMRPAARLGIDGAVGKFAVFRPVAAAAEDDINFGEAAYDGVDFASRPVVILPCLVRGQDHHIRVHLAHQRHDIRQRRHGVFDLQTVKLVRKMTPGQHRTSQANNNHPNTVNFLHKKRPHEARRVDVGRQDGDRGCFKKALIPPNSGIKITSSGNTGVVFHFLHRIANGGAAGDRTHETPMHGVSAVQQEDIPPLCADSAGQGGTLQEPS